MRHHIGVRRPAATRTEQEQAAPAPVAAMGDGYAIPLPPEYAHCDSNGGPMPILNLARTATRAGVVSLLLAHAAPAQSNPAQSTRVDPLRRSARPAAHR